MTSLFWRLRWCLVGISVYGLKSHNAQAAAWWYEQAERLQNVSAALLDGPPIAEPVPTKNFIAARMLTSLLPKPSAKVGDKEEKVPSAPVHGVPTLVAGMPLMTSGRYTLVGTGWAGYLPLPVAIAKTMGINASLSQFTFGASAENMFRLSNMILTTSAGFQYGNATLDGAITAANAKDLFNSTTMLFHVGQGVRSKTMPLWANAMFLIRRGTSKFNISLEQTEFVRTDNMSDAQIPIATQVTVGGSVSKSIQVALSEYIVPDRLIMPRVSVVYQYILGDESSSSTSPESVSDDKAKTPAPRKKRKKKNSTNSTSVKTAPKKGQSDVDPGRDSSGQTTPDGPDTATPGSDVK